MGIRLNSNTAQETTDKKPESASLTEGLALSDSNPVESPTEIVEDVAPVDISQERSPAAIDEAALEEASRTVLSQPNAPEFLSEDAMSEAVDTVLNRPAAILEDSKVVARKVDISRTQQLRDIQEQYKVSSDEAMGLLTQYPYEELKAQKKFAGITHDYPAMSKWAQKPTNMKLAQKDPDAFKKIEESSKMLGYFGDYGKVALQNVYMIPMMGLHAAVSTGTVSIEDAADMMAQVQEGIDANQITYNRPGLIEIGAGMEKLTKGLNTILPYKFSDKKGDVTLDSLGALAKKLDIAASNKDWSFLTRAYKRFKGTDTGLLDFLGSVIKNPSAALLMSGQSAYSMVPGLIAPIAGAAGGAAVGGPVGAAIGTVGASYTTGFAVAYSQFFQEESEKFKNKKTGKIDFRKMYSDPATVSRMRNMALKYGAAHGVFEAIGGKLLGKTFQGAKNATKGAKVAALTVETLEQAVTEGAGETFATSMTGKSIGESVAQGAAEAVFSVPFTPGAAMVQALNLARINAKEKKKKAGTTPPPPGAAPSAPMLKPVFKSPQEIIKIAAEKLEAGNAVQNRQIMQEMRETKTSPAVKDAPQQVQELIKESSNPTIEVGTDENGSILEDNIGQDTVISFDVNQWEALAEQVGEDPMAMAEHLGPKGVEAYIAAKKGDTGIFQVAADEYHRYSDNRPELDDIMYVNDSEMNAVEGKQTLDMAKELEELMLDSEDETTFDDDINDGNEPPPIPTDSDFLVGETNDTFTVFEPSTADESLGDLISRPIELIQSTRTKEQRVAYANILRKLNRTLKDTQAPKGLAEAMADIQFSHLRFRSEATGVKISELESNIGMGFSTKLPNNTLGQMSAIKGYTSQLVKIIFGKNTETSTVIHEFAHSWLHSMILDYPVVRDNLSRTAIQEDYYQAMLQVEKMFGVNSLSDIYRMNDTDSRSIHETFAQTAESYFLNGDMQNNGMRRVFEQVRKWMADVASMINRLTRSYPTLKLNPEIERMFRTILDASTEADSRTTEMFPEPLFTEDMLGPERAAKYKEAIADARDESVAKLYGKAFNGSLREREKLISDSLDQIQLQAENEVNELPAIVLMDLIKARGADAKITYQSILDHLAFGDVDIMEQLKEFIAPGVMAPNKRRGVDVRDVMEAFGVNDPSDFVNMLAQMKNRDQLVEARANQLMDSMFPALKTDEEMHFEAVKSIQESGREKILAMDLEILAEKHLQTLQQMNQDVVRSPLNNKRKTMDALKKIAIVRVLEAALKTFKPGQYLKEATKFNKQAASYLGQTDYLAAFDAKQREAVNTFAYLQATEVAKQIDKVHADIKKFMKLSPEAIGKNFDFDIYSAAKDFITEYQSGRILSDPSEVEGFDKMSETVQKIVTDLINAINSDLAVKDPGNPAIQTVLNMGEVVMLMRKQARQAKQIEINGKKEDRAVVAAQIAAELQGNGSVLSFEEKGKTLWRAGLASMDNLIAGMMSEKEFAGSTFIRKLDEVKVAENTRIGHADKDQALLLTAIKKMNKNNPEAQKVTKQLTDVSGPMRGRDLGKPVAAREINHTFTDKGELLKTRAISMSEDGRAKLLAGGIKSKGKDPTGPINPTAFDEMWARMERDGTITEADMEFIQTMLDIFESHYPAVKEAARKVDGFEIGYIAPRSVQAFGKTFKGGYVPLKRGESMTERLSKEFDRVDVEDNYVPEFYPVTNTSMEKERSNTAYPVNVDLGTLISELNAVYRVAYLRPVMYEVGKIISEPVIQKVMEQRRPGAMKAIVLPWFKKTMAQQYIERVPKDKLFFQGLETSVNNVSNRAKISIFLGNYFSVAKQPLGIIPAFALLPSQKVANAMAKVLISPRGMKNKIANMSPLMAERFDTNSRNIVRSLEDFSLNHSWKNTAKQGVELATYWPIQMAQNLTDTVVWTAAYDTAIFKLKLDLPQARAYADSFVIRTQTTNNISGMQGLRSGNVFVRMFTTFATVPIGMAGLQIEARGRAKGTAAPEYIALMANSYAFTAALPAILSAMVSLPAASLLLLSGGGDDEEREEAFDAIALRAIPEILDSALPVFGQNLAALFGGLEGDPRMAQVGVIPLARQVLSGAQGVRAGIGRALPSTLGESDNKVIRGIYDTLSVEEFTDRDYKNMATAAGLLWDVPVGAIPSIINRTEKVIPAINPDFDMEAMINDLDLPR